MEQYFSYPYTGGAFEQFGIAHQIALLVLLLIGLSFLVIKNGYRKSKALRIAAASILLVNEIGWHLWHAYHGLWTIQTLLPLNLCNLLVLCSVFALITKNQSAYEFTYLLGIPAASQVLITPALGQFGFPHILFFQIFISHGGIVLAALYLTIVEGMRPGGWGAVKKVVVWTTLYAIFIFFLNPFIGGNYLFLANKPPAATLIDFLGDWPWYVLSMELIGFILVVLMYLPFEFSNWNRKKGQK